MKYILRTTLSVMLACWLAGCGSETKKPAGTAAGKAYELIVSIPQAAWEGRLGDTLRSVFAAPVEMLNQVEPHFDMQRVVPSAVNDGLISRHRNILIIKSGAQYREPSMTAGYDVHAAPQLVVTVQGASDSLLAAYIGEHRTELLDIFQIAERDRALDFAARFKEPSIEKLVYEMFGMKIDIPKGYTLRNTEGNAFIWFAYEYPLASQGVFIYSYPFTGTEDFTQQALLQRRDEFARRIPGPSEGSFMTTNPEFIHTRYLKIHERTWSELRGFWEVHGDFMGGPFVSYSTLDKKSGRVVAIDCYVYSPKHPKRNLLRGLEHLVYSVSFPEETAREPQAGTADR